MTVIRQAMEKAEHLIINVGSAYQPRRPDINPFFASEREAMIRAALPREWQERVIVVPVADSNYDFGEWSASITANVHEIAAQKKSNPKISLIGHSKDRSSFYLKEFPQWGAIDVAATRSLDATGIRNAFLHPDKDVVEDMFKKAIDRQDLDVGVINWLREFQQQDVYQELITELEYYRSCHARWARESWPNSRNTVTADVLIEQANHILLVQRNEFPQKGSWMMPGGHLNINETIRECGLREGYEETGIKVPRVVFEKAYVGERTFDAPYRDPRGRYITTAFHYKLEPRAPDYDPTKTPVANRARIESALALPKVKGGDDARAAKWWHRSEITREMMGLDHYAIIQTMLAANMKKDQ